MRLADEIFERRARRDVLDAERHDRQALVDRALDLALDLRRGIGVAGIDQHHHPRVVDRADERFRPADARKDVARRDPHPDAIAFEDIAGGVGRRLILRGIAYEDVVSHGSDNNRGAAADNILAAPDSHSFCANFRRATAGRRRWAKRAETAGFGASRLTSPVARLIAGCFRQVLTSSSSRPSLEAGGQRPAARRAPGRARRLKGISNGQSAVGHSAGVRRRTCLRFA